MEKSGETINQTNTYGSPGLLKHAPARSVSVEKDVSVPVNETSERTQELMRISVLSKYTVIHPSEYYMRVKGSGKGIDTAQPRVKYQYFIGRLLVRPILLQ